MSYRECIRINPDYALGHYAIGVWFDTRRQWPEAIRAYREAVRLAPKNADMQFNLGNAYLKSKRIDEAIATFKQGLPRR